MSNDKNKPLSKLKSLVIIVALLLFSAAITAPFFYAKYQIDGGRKTHQMLHTHDMVAHLAMMDQFDHSIHSGLIEPRWFSDVNNGYGSATLNFYPRVFYYITSFTNLFAHDWNTSIFAISILALAASGLSFYWLSRLFYGPAASAIAGLLYMLMPYHQIDLYWRGAIPEYIGFAILPLILRFAIRVATKPSARDYAALGFFYGIHLMTHMPVGLMFSYAMVMFAVLWSFMTKDPKITVRIGTGMALGVIFSATYWLPALLEARYIYEPASAIFPYHQTYIQTAIGANIFDDIISLSFKFSVLLILASAVVVKAKSARDSNHSSGEQKILVNLWIIVGATTLFLCTSLSYDISRLLPKIQAAVPPFRWLSIASLFACLLVAASIDRIRFDRPGLIRPVILAIVLGLNLWLNFFGAIGGSMSNTAEVVPPGIVDSGFIPAGARMPQLLPDTQKVVFEPEGGQSEVVQWEPETRQIKVHVSTPSTVRLKTYNYRGWTATLDGSRVALNSDSDGIQLIDVGPGTHTIETSFKNVWQRTTGQILSILGLVAILSLSIFAQSPQQRTTVDETKNPATSEWSLVNLTQNKKLLVTLGVFAAIAVAVFVILSGRFGRQPKQDQHSATAPAGAQSSTTAVDSDALLFIQGVPTISVAVDEQSLDQLVDSLSRQDRQRVENLSQSGKLLSVENKTRVRVMQRGSGKMKIRIAEGKYQFAEGWVLEAWVH